MRTNTNVLPKMSKQEAQQRIAENLKALAKIKKQYKSDMTPEQEDKRNIKITLIKTNISLVIDAAFRGDEPHNSTAFDLTTDLLTELRPFFNKSIGEARREQIGKAIADYFTPEAVNGYKLKCYLHCSCYSTNINYYLTFNGYTNGMHSDLDYSTYISDCDADSKYFDLENGHTMCWNGERRPVHAPHRYASNYTEVAELNKAATKIYNNTKKAAAQVQKYIDKINEIIDTTQDNCRFDYFTDRLYMSSIVSYSRKQYKSI